MTEFSLKKHICIHADFWCEIGRKSRSLKSSRRGKRGKKISAVIVALVFFCTGDASQSLSAIGNHTVSGHVQTRTDSIPIPNEIITFINYSTGTYKNVPTNANGDFSFDFPEYSLLEVLPTMGIYEEGEHPWNSFVVSIEGPQYIMSLDKDETINFTINPGVVVTVSAPDDGPTVAGVKLYYGHPFFEDVATFTNGLPVVVFYPDDYTDEYYGTMPYAGELRLYGYPYFFEFDPQDVTGDFIQYDCNAKYLDGDNPVINYQHFLPVVDVPAEYTWDNPGGIGWSYFPATPDNRLKNNPNVRVGVHFTGTTGLWAKEDLRINGITATYDLTPENEYTTEFSYPIPECGEMELRVEYQYPNRYGSPIWFPLDTHKITGASNADLVVDPQNTINMTDLVAFSPMIGTCEGDSAYSPCGDFFPSGCINTSDLQIMAEIYYTDPNKNRVVAADLPSDVWLSGIDRSDRDFIIKTEVTWEAAIVRFKLPIKDPSGITWSPSRPFIDRSILVSKNTDDGIIFSLVILGPSEAGTTELGSLSSASLDVLDRIQFQSTEIGSAEEPIDKIDSPVSLSATLGNASPNPFNPKTTISFDLPKQTAVRMVIYDVSGRLTRTLIDGEIVETGRHEIVWNGRDDMGKQVAAGVYFCRLDTDEYSETKRMALVK